MEGRQETVEKLASLLESNRPLAHALETSLKEAKLHGIETVDQFYNYLDKILTHVPTEKEMMPSVREFYYILSKSPDDLLKKDPVFNEWINEFVVSRGNFLDTTESVETLDSFINDPKYKIDEYIKNPSGWLTFNQFLARELKPGKRPVAGLCNKNIIVSPADSTYKGQWPIMEDSTITAKQVTYSVQSLLDGSAYAHKFQKGIFTHSFLDITDYHRFHMPVAGKIVEVRKIPAGTWVTTSKKPDGTVENIDDVGFQFTHTRAYIIIESAVGFVAVMPVGMGHISSVVITVDESADLVKGEEFGYFAFGGSDIIMLFEPGQVEFIAKENEHYNQGQEIARAVKTAGN